MTVLLLSGTAHMHAQDGPFSLPYPENISESIDYDDLSGNYLRGLKLNGTFLEVPTLMTPKEYASWKMRQDMNAYFHDKYSEPLYVTTRCAHCPAVAGAASFWYPPLSRI